MAWSCFKVFVHEHVLLFMDLLLVSVNCLLLTESPDIVKCLTNIVNMCFPDNVHRLLLFDDGGQSATSPLVLIAIFQRLQHHVTGGSMTYYSQYLDCEN